MSGRADWYNGMCAALRNKVPGFHPSWTQTAGAFFGHQSCCQTAGKKTQKEKSGLSLSTRCVLWGGGGGFCLSGAGRGGGGLRGEPPKELWAIARVDKRQSAQSAERQWLVSGQEDHRYLCVTNSETRRCRWVGQWRMQSSDNAAARSKPPPCNGHRTCLSMNRFTYTGKAGAPSPRGSSPDWIGVDGSSRGVSDDSIGKSYRANRELL